MNTRLTVDKAGRVVLPKPVRDELQLSPGDSLELDSCEDQIVLRPVRARVGMRKKQGIWMLDFDEPVSAAQTDRVLRGIRLDRERSTLAPQLNHKAASAKKRKNQ